MILAIDIGNTNITFGLFDGDTLSLVSRLATERNRTPDQYTIDFINILSLHRIDTAAIEGTVISSVVPELTNVMIEAIGTINRKVTVLGPGVKTGLNILIDDPAMLGADLAAGAVGAIAHYPLPAFVIDLGTASKIYAVDENHAFLGGIISPGIEISLKALTDTSSQLPTIALNAPSKVCSTNTVECMQSGVIYGTAFMIDGMLDRFQNELFKPASIIATGGLASCIIDECSHDIIYDNQLILKGLKAIYDKNN